MNLFKSIKNRKGAIGAIGAVSAGIMILILAFAIASVSYMVPVLANTHTSHVVLNTTIVKGGINYGFAVTVYNDGGADISEFRIYNNTAALNGGLEPFTNLVCYPADGWYGPFYIPSSTGDYCHYTAKTEADRIQPTESKTFTFSADAPTTDCWRKWHFETRDPDDFYTPIYTNVAVDALKPITTKSFDGPQKIVDGVEWIDGVTKVVLTATDPEPHPAGVDKTYYYNELAASDEPCLSTSVCDEYRLKHPSLESFIEYVGPFLKEESCHILWYYSVDKVENVESMKVNCFFVDKTPPEIDKDVGDPKVEGDGETFDWWVTQDTPITLKCKDVGDHPSNDVTIYWKYIVDGGLPVEGSYKGEEKTIKFTEDSVHELEFWCKDAVQKESRHDIETFKVDTVAPYLTDKYIEGPYYEVKGSCPPTSETDICHLDGSSDIHIEVEDGGDICAVDRVWCQWGYYLNGDTGKFYGWYSTFPIQFPEESEHDLVIECYDALGNKMTDEETFFVDKTPPKTTKTYGEPVYPAEGYPKWITSDTEITLSAVDNIGPHDSGVAATYYRVTLLESNAPCYNVDDCAKMSGVTDFITYSTPFKIGEESCHLIEYYSVDNVDKTETVKKQCVFVENTAPTIGKTVGQPKLTIDDKTYITSKTPITLYCDDLGDHPVDDVTIWYRYRFAEDCEDLDEAQWTTEGCTDGVVNGWCDTVAHEEQKTIYFPQDSCHELEYYCIDALGNEGQHQFEIDIVDSQAPDIDIDIDGPQYGDFIDGVTEIDVSATDPTPHPVDEVTCDWWYVLDDTTRIPGEEDLTPPFTINFKEETKHELHVVCEDALGNSNEVVKTYFVDKTAPGIWKRYEEPYFEYENNYYAEFISSATTIHAGVTDDGPHKSGIHDVEYRVTLVDDEYCRVYGEDDKFKCEDAVGDGTWTDVNSEDFDEFTFTIPKDSCHLIEIYAEDNVEKSSTHKQCVFVDNKGPIVNKVIGEPKTEWEGDDTFYLGLKARCAADEIDCWKITLGTLLNLSCSDPEPHPVDHSTLCFQIELDGDDVTGEENGYCYIYGGQMQQDGYCCLQSGAEMKNFQFLEESQHDLKVKCTDALGNEGAVDEEKFKVEGCPYDLCLEKKWNLVSVPFTLFDSEPEIVFNGTNNKIVSVWSYDPTNTDCGIDGWCTWVPGVGGNLEQIKPGYGYWILSKDSECFELGGSLFNSKEVPPSRTLEPGWNLIGYYGNTGLNGINFFQTEQTNPWQCEIADRPVYCALNSLVDTQQGFPRWSSLYTFINEGNDNAYWDGLDACVGQWWGVTEYMNPGQGYWIEMDVADGYAPATNCIWNTQLKCVPEFPS